MSGPFNVGDVVVCVDARTPPANTTVPPIGTLLNEGSYYRLTYVAKTSVRVAEVSPWAFEMWRFRPLGKADSKFAASMRALRPIRVGEPA